MALSTDEMRFNVLFTQTVRRSPPQVAATSGKTIFINSKPHRGFARCIEVPLSRAAACSVG
jgi:hypothetical protein